MIYSSKVAEILGIMLGDGSSYYNDRHGIYQTTVAGHSIHDRNYLLNYVKPLFENAFGVKMELKIDKRKKTIWLRNQTKKLALELEKLGFPIGNKLKNNVKIPEWIFEDRSFLKACLRGLIDTDGSVCPKSRFHKVPSIWLVSNIPNLRDSVDRTFKILNFNPSKWSSNSNRPSPQCCLGSSKEVIKYYKEIGFSNPYHNERFVGFMKAPIV